MSATPANTRTHIARFPRRRFRLWPTPSRDVILEAIHFLVEIRNPRHARLSGMLSIRSYGPPAETCPQGHYAAFVVCN
jgi:hypothetical protein